MKIKCSVCGRTVLQRPEVAVKAAAKGGYGSLEDYLKEYKCLNCRNQSSRGKTTQPQPKSKTQSQSQDQGQSKPKIRQMDELAFLEEESDESEEKELDQSFEIEGQFFEGDDDRDDLDEELEEELDRLLEDEDDEEEI